MRRTLLKNCSGDSAVKLILLRAGQRRKGCWCIPWLPSHLLGSMLRKPLKDQTSYFFGLFSFTGLPGANFFVHLVSGILIYTKIIVKHGKGRQVPNAAVSGLYRLTPLILPTQARWPCISPIFANEISHRENKFLAQGLIANKGWRCEPWKLESIQIILVSGSHWKFNIYWHATLLPRQWFEYLMNIFERYQYGLLPCHVVIANIYQLIYAS